MANSITGINDDIIAMSALDAFIFEMAPLRAFCTDFSEDARRPGEKISVPRITALVDAAVIKVTHAAYTVQDAHSDAVEITLGQPYYVSWALDDTEVASSSVLSLDLYGRQKGYGIAKKVFQDVLSVVTNANYGAASYTGAAGAFDSDDVADIAEDGTAAGWPRNERSLLLRESYYTALSKDTDIKHAYAYGGPEAIREQMIPRVMGFTVYETTLIPSNSENLVGLAAHASAIAIAMRYLMPQDGNTYFRAEPLTDPETGITLGLRDFYDNITGRRIRILEAVHGYIAGITTGIKRIVSA